MVSSSPSPLLSFKNYTVAYSSSCGRHLIASRHIEPGQLILQQEPYVAVLYDDQVSLRCDYCFLLPTIDSCLLRCSRSKHARYCSRDHQKAAWESGYKNECKALIANAPRLPPPTIRLAAKALWRSSREQQQGNGNQDEYGNWSAVQPLLSHWDDLPDNKKKLYAQMAVVTREFAASGMSESSLDPDDHFPSVKEIANLLARFACNNHTICDEELRPVGVGLYPLGALLNHSCRPNCMQRFGVNGRIEFRSLIHISQGEPLTISYVELAATRQERREELASTYYFDIGPPQPLMLPLPQEAVEHDLTPVEHDLTPSETNVTSQCSALPRQPPTSEIDFILNCDDLGLDGSLLQLAHQKVVGLKAGTTYSFQGRLRVYPGLRSDQEYPPWPIDPHDVLLTQVVQFCTPVLSDGVGPSEVTLLGGAQVHLVRQDVEHLEELEEDCDDGDEEDSDPADMQLSHGVVSPGQGCEGSYVAEVECWGGFSIELIEMQIISGGKTEFQPHQNASDLMSTTLGSLVKRMAAAVHLQAEAEKLRKQGKHKTAVQFLLKALEKIDAQEGHPVGLGQSHLMRMRLNAALLKQAVDEGNSWDHALSAARALMPVYQLVYPGVWPNLGLHHATLAKLELLQGCPKAGLKHAQLALSNLEVTHQGYRGGRGPSVLEQVGTSLMDAMAAISLAQ